MSHLVSTIIVTTISFFIIFINFYLHYIIERKELEEEELFNKVNDKFLKNWNPVNGWRKYNGEMCRELDIEEYKELEKYMKQFEIW